MHPLSSFTRCEHMCWLWSTFSESSRCFQLVSFEKNGCWAETRIRMFGHTLRLRSLEFLLCCWGSHEHRVIGYGRGCSDEKQNKCKLNVSKLVSTSRFLRLWLRIIIRYFCFCKSEVRFCSHACYFDYIIKFAKSRVVPLFKAAILRL